MKLIDKEGDNLNPERITVELERSDGELFAEALDHAGHGLQRVIDERKERGETREPENLPADPNDYGKLAANIAMWFGIDYTDGVHFLDDAIRGEEERKGASATRILEASREFRRTLEAEEATRQADEVKS